MPLDALPAKLVVPSRDQLRQKYKTWVQVRNPAADTRQGGAVDLDSLVWADAGSSLMNTAVSVSNGVSRSTATGQRLDDWAKSEGTQRQGPIGAAGAVAATIGATGSTIFSGDLLTHIPSGLRFQVTNTGLYTSGTAIPINGVDTGPETNLPAGTVLTWQVTRPGVTGPTATVLAAPDGSGLFGGVNAETDDVLQARLDYMAANPPASGNDVQYQLTAQNTPGVAVQQAFTYPAILGPGTIGICFTLRNAQPGGPRIPNATQQALVAAYLGGVMPANDSAFMCPIVAVQLSVVLKVLWAVGAAGWADGTQFPLYHANSAGNPNPNPNLVSASANAAAVLSTTAFRLSSPAMTEVPQVGQNVAFFDQFNLVFRRKRIGAVTTINATTYDITVDTTTGVSDTGYTPLLGQICCPWSDSLNSLVTSVVTYFDTLGPGEQVPTFYDPGMRQRRSPVSPQYWPSTITNRLIGGASVPVPAQGPQQNQPPVPTLMTTSTIQDVVLQEPVIPLPVQVGVPAISSNMFVLGPSFVVFPE